MFGSSTFAFRGDDFLKAIKMKSMLKGGIKFI